MGYIGVTEICQNCDHYEPTTLSKGTCGNKESGWAGEPRNGLDYCKNGFKERV